MKDDQNDDQNDRQNTDKKSRSNTASIEMKTMPVDGEIAPGICLCCSHQAMAVYGHDCGSFLRECSACGMHGFGFLDKGEGGDDNTLIGLLFCRCESGQYAVDQAANLHCLGCGSTTPMIDVAAMLGEIMELTLVGNIDKPGENDGVH